MSDVLIIVCVILFLIWVGFAILVGDPRALMLPFLWIINYSNPDSRRKIREMRKRDKEERKKEDDEYWANWHIDQFRREQEYRRRWYK